MSNNNELLAEVFETNKGFVSEDYKDFLNEVFREYYDKKRAWPATSSDGKEYRLTKLGTYEDSEGVKLDFLVIESPTSTKVQRARVEQRQIVSKYLKEEGIYNGVHNVLVVFYSTCSNDWRLSFVKQEFKLDENNKVKEDYTPAKRKSFLIEQSSKNNTVKKQFTHLITQKEQPSVEQVEEAFSIEKVTKEFFQEYRKLYEELKSIVEKDDNFKKIDTRGDENFTGNFVKKLMGQIVFLYFLQKKGWLGIPEGGKYGDGNKNFMKELYDEWVSEGKDFYNDCLVYLFYDTLNKKRENNWSKYFKCKIPFLNGGLFEPIKGYDWENEKINIPNDIFGKIFEVFDTFNFTIYENDPLESDVAVDPEILGKVWENLLPENERRGSGSYYTPKEIVRYMAQESIIYYLVSKTNQDEGKIREIMNQKDADCSDFRGMEELGYEIEDALSSVKVCDPAVGSGAFPMGILQEVLSLRKFVSTEFIGIDPKTDYELKKEILENNLYGVDKDKGAIDICRLRFWLSLVVDEEAKEEEPYPLPNFDYKFIQGNSLLENMIIGERMINVFGDDGTLWRHDDMIDELKDLHQRYFDENNYEKKRIIEDKIDNLEEKLIEKRTNQVKQNYKEKIRNIENKYSLNNKEIPPKEREKIAEYHENIEKIDSLMAQFKVDRVKNFLPWKLYMGDVFKHNGGFDIVISNPPYVFSRGADFSDNFKKIISKTYLTGQGKINLFSLFIEKGINVLSKNGIISYIIPNTLFRVTSYKPIRKFIIERTKVLSIVDLNETIFEGVTASTTIIVLENINKVNPNINFINNFKDLKLGLVKNYIDQGKFINDEFIISLYDNKEENNIFNKMKEKSIKLGEITKDIINGIVTPKGKNDFISNTRKNDKRLPFLEGKDIDRYTIRNFNKYLFYDRKLLHRPRPQYIRDAKEKIIIRRIGGGERALFATLDINNYLTFASTNLILLKNYDYSYKYVLGLINSNLINWFYLKNFTNSSKLTVNISKTYLDKLPIRQISLQDQQPFIDLVDKILSITEKEDYDPNNSNSQDNQKIKQYERQIDELVYDLYELTYEERKIVEPDYEPIKIEGVKETTSEKLLSFALADVAKNISEKLGTDVKDILSEEAIESIASNKPTSPELLIEYGVPENTVYQFGDQIIQVVEKYKS